MSAAAITILIGLSVGLIPVPDFVIDESDLSVDIQAHESMAGDISYSYTVRNSENNTGEIAFFNLQVEVPRGHAWPRGRDDLFVYPHKGKTLYSEMADPAAYTPIQTEPEEGWENWVHGDVISFFPGSQPGVPPGKTAGPFKVISPAPPALRMVEIEPQWALKTQAHDPTPDQMRRAEQVYEMLRQELTTVGPFGVRPNSGIYLEKFLSDMKALPDMGWCDAGFTESAHELVSTHKEGIQSADYDTREPVSEFIESLPAWEDVCSRQEAYLLVKFGLEAMLGQLPEATPASATTLTPKKDL